MRIGSVREIKKFEYRVGLTPDNVKSYVNAGHQVYICLLYTSRKVVLKTILCNL